MQGLGLGASNAGWKRLETQCGPYKSYGPLQNALAMWVFQLSLASPELQDPYCRVQIGFRVLGPGASFGSTKKCGL